MRPDIKTLRLEEIDFSNEDIMMEVLEDGTDAQLEALRKHRKFTCYYLQLYRYYARLRREILVATGMAKRERIAKNPEPTFLELDLGVFKESLEPQVREAVLALNRKGYATVTSGFWACGQAIAFQDFDILKDFVFPEAVRIGLALNGIIVKVRSHRISFECETELGIEELMGAWLKIAEQLSCRGEPAEPCLSKVAIDFRKRFGKR